MSAAGEEFRLARSRLAEILAKANKLEVSTQEILTTRPARKLLARTSGVLGRCALRLGLLALVLAGLYVYARWPTQEVETVRTVLRKTCDSRNIADRIATLVQSGSGSLQDEC